MTGFLLLQKPLRRMKMPKINSVWKLITCNENSVHELRAFNPATGATRTQLFTPRHGSAEEKKQGFELTALKLNDEGFNIYTTLNPIKPSFQGGAAKDTDIECRRLLLIDIDRTGDAKQPATDKGVKAAKKLAEKIIDHLAVLGWPKPNQVMSGNGWHLYYQLDELTNDSETTELIKQTLKLLAKHFNNSIVEIDTCVFNASRITKVPGTIMRKGDESDDRPYRMAVLHG